MTLVEVLIVVALIGMLSAILVPAISTAMKQRDNAQAASKLRRAVMAFDLYRSEMGHYPEDVGAGITPPEMVHYFAEMGIDEWWEQATELGGKWDWDDGYHFAYSVSIHNPSCDFKQLKNFDSLLDDDGDLETGKFRRVNSHYHYIIEE